MSVDFGRGQFTAIMGPSGSVKVLRLGEYRGGRNLQPGVPGVLAAFAASLWGFILSISNVERPRLAGVVRLLPRRAPAVLMIISGVVTTVIWVGPVMAAQFQGTPPARLDHDTTLVTVAIDARSSHPRQSPRAR